MGISGIIFQVLFQVLYGKTRKSTDDHSQAPKGPVRDLRRNREGYEGPLRDSLKITQGHMGALRQITKLLALGRQSFTFTMNSGGY